MNYHFVKVSFLNIKKWGGDKGGRIKKCPDYRSGIR